jgi:HlyD family secretion protein
MNDLIEKSEFLGTYDANGQKEEAGLRSGKCKVFVIAVTVLGLIAGCAPQQNNPGARMGQSQRAVPVEVKKAGREDFHLAITLSGRLEASQQVEITSKATGRIKQIHVKIGDQVKAGQPILTLEGEEVRIQLQRSEAALQSARARYTEALEGTPEETLVQSQNTLADLQIKYEAAKKELERTEALFRQGAISAAELEKARTNFASASTSLENQKQKLKLDQKGPTRSTIEAALAQLKQAEADYALAKLNAANLVVKAPIDGVIGSLSVTTGGNVSSNTAIAQLINISVMKVKTQATESQIGQIKTGDSAEVKIPSIGYATTGKITAVSPLPDSSKSYPIEMEIANPDLRLKAGMIASIEIKGQPRKALVVPREAVISKDQQTYVFVVAEGKAKQVNVKTGESDGERMEILEGLQGGEEVVVTGQNTLVEGVPVVVIDPNKPVPPGDTNKSGNPNRQSRPKG